MTNIAFKKIKAASKRFSYTSLTYLPYEALSDYRVVYDDENLILVVGYNAEQDMEEAHWAASIPGPLLRALKNKGLYLVPFVPPHWEQTFLSRGFVEHAVYCEYWISQLDLMLFDAVPPAKRLLRADFRAAAKITQACRGQSRGFHGETAAWVACWLDGTEPGLTQQDTLATSALTHRDGNGKLDGVIFVAVYGSSKKGPIVWIRELAVLPEAQNRGVGRTLLRQGLLWGQRHGAKRAFLMADTCNAKAIRIYTSCGFEPSDDTPQIDLFGEAK